MGLFTIFKKKAKRLSTPVDLGLLNTDVHSHLVPAIDDGSKSVDDSVNMITQLHSLGYKKLITTPHIMGDGYRNTPDSILGGLEKVKSALLDNQLSVEMAGAAEYYLDYDFERKLDNEKLLTFGKNYLLFEISYMNPPDNLYHVIFKMQTLGYKPVLAHPERYNFWHKEFDKYEAFIDKGVLLQMNINSLSGYYSIPTKKVAEQMIDKNMISFVGSDCHHMGHVNLMKEVVFEPHLKQLIESGNLLNNTL
jgi:tyrosine-protein phosphatase YwqE